MNDLSKLPMDYPTVPFQVEAEIMLIKLARELAQDIHPLQTILDRHGVDDEQWEKLKRNRRFAEIWAAEVQAWNTAINTSQRVKLKAGSMLEEWLPELYSRLIDRSEPIMGKVKAGELVARLAGFGEHAAKVVDPSDRVSITINLGADSQLQFNKPRTPKVIDHEGPVLEEDQGLLAGEEEAHVSAD